MLQITYQQGLQVKNMLVAAAAINDRYILHIVI